MTNKSSSRGPISLKIWIYGFFGALMKTCEFEENQNFACAQPPKDLESLAKSVLRATVCNTRIYNTRIPPVKK